MTKVKVTKRNLENAVEWLRQKGGWPDFITLEAELPDTAVGEEKKCHAEPCNLKENHKGPCDWVRAAPTPESWEEQIVAAEKYFMSRGRRDYKVYCEARDALIRRVRAQALAEGGKLRETLGAAIDKEFGVSEYNFCAAPQRECCERYCEDPKCPTRHAPKEEKLGNCFGVPCWHDGTNKKCVFAPKAEKEVPPGDCIYGCKKNYHPCGRYPEFAPIEQIEELPEKATFTADEAASLTFGKLNEIIRLLNRFNHGKMD